MALIAAYGPSDVLGRIRVVPNRAPRGRSANMAKRKASTRLIAAKNC